MLSCMIFFPRLPLTIGLQCAILSVFLPVSAHAQIYKEAIGYNQLASELGANLPDGSGIDVIQVEAPAAGNYLPNTTNAQFSGKTISAQSGASGVS